MKNQNHNSIAALPLLEVSSDSDVQKRNLEIAMQILANQNREEKIEFIGFPNSFAHTVAEFKVDGMWYDVDISSTSETGIVAYNRFGSSASKTLQKKIAEVYFKHLNCQ
jgi:hypothetical protein